MRQERPSTKQLPIVKISSATLLNTLVIQKLKHSHVNVLSIINNNLLAGYKKSRDFYTCCVKKNNFILNSKINTSYSIRDISWTPSGEILFIDEDSNNVILHNQSNLNTQEIRFTDPSNLNLSSDNVLYLTDWKRGVYESTNNGKTWCHLFKPEGNAKCWQVIKVETESGEAEYWTQIKLDENHYLRAYKLMKDDNGNQQVTWHAINLKISRKTRINLYNSCLAFDGYNSVLVSEWENSAVHVFSTKGDYQLQLLSYPDLHEPTRIVVNKDDRLLYVGQQKGEVKLFALA